MKTIKSKICLRDDDISFHTNVVELKKAYGQYLGVVPISFGCIPFAGKNISDKSKGIHIDESWKRWLSEEENSISKNKELCDFLSSLLYKNNIEIMLHGINHTIGEFEVNQNNIKRLGEGIKELEKTFKCSLKTCSPPNNRLSKHWFKELNNRNINILSGFAFYPWERPICKDNIYNFIKLLYLYAKYQKKHRLTRPMKIKSIKEMPCYHFGPNTCFSDLEEGLLRVQRKGGSMVIATHWYHLSTNTKLRNIYWGFIDQLQRLESSKKIELVLANSLF